MPRPRFTADDLAIRFVQHRVCKTLESIKNVDQASLTEFVGSTMNGEKFAQIQGRYRPLGGDRGGTC